MWEVRQRGVRHCQCGSFKDAYFIASMRQDRTLHRVLPPIEPETVDVSAEDLGPDPALRPQIILNLDDREPLDL